MILSSPKIATVTPIAINADIVSLPEYESVIRLARLVTFGETGSAVKTRKCAHAQVTENATVSYMVPFDAAHASRGERHR